MANGKERAPTDRRDAQTLLYLRNAREEQKQRYASPMTQAVRAAERQRMDQRRAERSVLIVDDDYPIRRTLAEILDEEGYASETAGNGRDALILLRDAPTRFRLIILDIMMPIMDGREFRVHQLADP